MLAYLEDFGTQTFLQFCPDVSGPVLDERVNALENAQPRDPSSSPAGSEVQTSSFVPADYTAANSARDEVSFCPYGSKAYIELTCMRTFSRIQLDLTDQTL